MVKCDLLNTLLVLDAIFHTCKMIDEVPKDASLMAVLFRSENRDAGNGAARYLYPYYSFDGANHDFFDQEYEECKTHFDLGKPTASVAVFAAVEGEVQIVENAERAHSDPKNAFKFFANEQRQRTTIRSMVAIPFTDAVYRDKWVLCVSSNRERTFRNDHRWKYEETQKHIEVRVNHLLRASALLDAIKLEKDGLQQGTGQGSAVPDPHVEVLPTSSLRMSQDGEIPLD